MKCLRKFLWITVLSNIFFVFAADWTDQFTNTADIFNSTISDIENGVQNFSKELTFSIPMSASQQNVWADAYIGKLFPAVPVHFGFGVNASATRLSTKELSKTAKIFNIDNHYCPKNYPKICKQPQETLRTHTSETFFGFGFFFFENQRDKCFV